MRLLKLCFALAAVVALTQYAPIYYYSSEFEEYVQMETRHARGKRQLKQMLVTKASDYKLPVQEENIDISTADAVFRVAVDYRVPINFYLFKHELAFHTVASRPIFSER